jgi:hypothetical protein
MTLEHPLVNQALATAHKLGLNARVVEREPALGRGRADALIEIEYGEQHMLYAAEVRRALTPGTIGPVLQGLKRLGEQALLVTDYVTPPLADRLRQERIAFLDAAGNAYLDRPPLLVWVKGQKPAAKPVPPETGRAFQAGGLQVLFALLCHPQEINKPYRELAKLAGVAHGTVGWVMADLRRLGHIRAFAGRRAKRKLHDAKRLLAQWTEAYARTLRPRTLIDRYFIPTLQGWKDWDVAKYGAMWGGEPAAAILTGYLKPGELTIYAEKLPGMLAAQQRFIRRPDHGHAAIVDMRKRFWDFPTEADRKDVTPPLLVYADLLATGDGRCIETAQLVYDEYLARLFTEA